MPQIQILSRAKLDLAEIAEYLGKDDPSLGLRFFDAAEQAFAEIAANPRIGGFDRFLVFYRIRDQKVLVTRIIHSAQDIESAF